MNYSGYWRINKSSVNYVELSNALRALRKVAGMMDVDAEVVWAGMPSRNSTKEKIELSPILAQEYPIRDENMDVLVGLDIHQALHIMEESQHVWDYLSQTCYGMKGSAILSKLAEAGEDIHVDGVAIKRGLPGKYVKRSRAWWKKNYQSDFTAIMPNPDGLFGIWTYLVLDVIFSDMNSQEMEKFLQLPTESLETTDIESLARLLCSGKTMPIEIFGTLLNMPGDYMEPLQMLLRRTPEIVNADVRGRANCYKELWLALKEYFLDWEAKRKEVESSEQLHEFQPPPDALAEKLPPALGKAVQQAMASEAGDVTEAIKTVLKDIGAAGDRQYVRPTIVENAIEPLDQAPNLDLVWSLAEIFRLYLGETMRINHGLDSGKLDAKRLSRVFTTGKVFSQKEYHQENNQWDIIILIDASSSIEWFWNQMKDIYAALAAALREDSIKLEILAYRYIEANDICQIKNLFYNNKLFTTDTDGDTPSGEAIIAAALRMPPGGHNLIMHFTDGIKNVGVPVKDAVEFCRLRGVDLITLGYGEATAYFYPYGDSWEPLGTLVDKLPYAVATLLKRKLVKRS